jgi:hypothetical protein
MNKITKKGLEFALMGSLLVSAPKLLDNKVYAESIDFTSPTDNFGLVNPANPQGLYSPAGIYGLTNSPLNNVSDFKEPYGREFVLGFTAVILGLLGVGLRYARS